MRLPSAAWFALGCGLAVLTGGLGHLALSSVRGDAWADDPDAAASLQALTPAPDDRASTVIAPYPDPDAVPLQRPRHLRDTPPVAPPPPLPLSSTSGVHDARLPTPEATVYWNPDDPRMPDGDARVVATRAYWNPNSATLPRPRTVSAISAWDPDDARLPPS